MQVTNWSISKNSVQETHSKSNKLADDVTKDEKPSDSGSSVLVLNFRWQNLKGRGKFTTSGAHDVLQLHHYRKMTTVTSVLQVLWTKCILTFSSRRYSRQLQTPTKYIYIFLEFSSLYCNFEVLLCENRTKLPCTSWSGVFFFGRTFDLVSWCQRICACAVPHPLCTERVCWI